MIAIICAIASGMTIVLSRSINGYLAKKIGPYQSTFFNYFTGLLTSSILLFFTLLPAFKNISFTNLLQKKYLAIKSQLFKKEVPIKSLFSLYLLG